MFFQILDYITDEIVEIDDMDIKERFDRNDSRTILEHADGQLFEVDTYTLDELGFEGDLY